jgi:methylmalonyl-CoA mutase N-terminal domain/subunit
VQIPFLPRCSELTLAKTCCYAAQDERKLPSRFKTDARGPMMQTQKDQPWLFRTYAGHSTAAASNALYRGNLAKGQTGLSVAFDLPTQTGYDSDHILSRGEVGKVGVPVSHLGDMRS